MKSAERTWWSHCLRKFTYQLDTISHGTIQNWPDAFLCTKHSFTKKLNSHQISFRDVRYSGSSLSILFALPETGSIQGPVHPSRSKSIKRRGRDELQSHSTCKQGGVKGCSSYQLPNFAEHTVFSLSQSVTMFPLLLASTATFSVTANMLTACLLFSSQPDSTRLYSFSQLFFPAYRFKN